jgi:hypothetical protein
LRLGGYRGILKAGVRHSLRLREREFLRQRGIAACRATISASAARHDDSRRHAAEPERRPAHGTTAAARRLVY